MIKSPIDLERLDVRQIIVTVRDGTPYVEAIREATQLALLFFTEVEFRFNGKRVTVNSNGIVAQIIRQAEDDNSR